MFTRSALVLAFLASMVLAGFAPIGPLMADPGLAASLAPVLLLTAVAAASAMSAERVFQLNDRSDAFSFEPADEPANEVVLRRRTRLAHSVVGHLERADLGVGRDRRVDLGVGQLGRADSGVGHIGRVDLGVGHPGTVGVLAGRAGGSGPAHGLGPAADSRLLQTVPPITLAAPCGLR